MTIPHVVIIGGGFGGLAAARALGREDVRVTLLDRSNHHLFQPLLYQVATAALSAPDIAAPIRRLLRHQKNTTVLMANVEQIAVAEKVVHTDRGPIEYDHLIVAAGMKNGYFGHDEWAEHAPGLKSLSDALEIRSRILQAFESAEAERDAAEKQRHLTFVVIGAGPTGVELAGAVAEIARRTLARDFRNFDPATAKVILVEGGPRVLPSFHESLSASAERALEQTGVEIRKGVRVSALDADGVVLGDQRVRAGTVLWAAGVEASPLTKNLSSARDRAGRIQVRQDLRLPDRDDVFVVGDLIALSQDGKPLPGVAQLAIQSGRHAAKNVLASIAGRPLTAFRYVDKGSMATIGRAKAIAETGNTRLTGFIAWCLWLFIHILFLVDFRNRMAVLGEWAYAYLTWQRSSRVIFDPHGEETIAKSPAPAPPREAPVEVRA